jgi:hypothetical protein
MSAYPRNARGLRDGADPQDVEAYLASLVASRVFKEDPARLRRDVADARAADEVEKLQKRSAHVDPDARHKGPGGRPKDLNRHLRRARARKKRLAKVVQAMIERAREEGSDPAWKPEAFPALDWRIKSEAWAIMRDVGGRRARIFTAALPPAQGARLVEEAARIAADMEIEEGYATVRWRELVAGAWVSWRLSRPIRARKPMKPDAPTRLRDDAGGNPPLDPEDLVYATRRENPWAGGRVVDGYARKAFCLLMRDLRTGAPMSVSKLFYRNGSGQQGVFGYLAAPAPMERSGKLPRIDGVLGLYSRFQPRADKSKYVGPPKRGPDGKPLLDANGNVQRYALGEHWYHRDMCGRRAVARADRGDGEARSLLRVLCPWLFDAEDSVADLLEESALRRAPTNGEPRSQTPDEFAPRLPVEATSRGPD